MFVCLLKMFQGSSSIELPFSAWTFSSTILFGIILIFYVDSLAEERFSNTFCNFYYKTEMPALVDFVNAIRCINYRLTRILCGQFHSKPPIINSFLSKFMVLFWVLLGHTLMINYCLGAFTKVYIDMSAYVYMPYVVYGWSMELCYGSCLQPPPSSPSFSCVKTTYFH